MTEIEFLKKLNKSYKELNLKYLRLFTAFSLMMVTALLEMAGLSVLYPLILLLGGDQSHQSGLSQWILTTPIHSLLSLNTYNLFILFALLFCSKNIILYFTYRYNIGFATYYYKNFVSSIYKVYLHKPILDIQSESMGYLTNLICSETKQLIHGVIRPFLVLMTEFMIMAGISLFLFVMNPWLISTIILGCVLGAGGYYLALRRLALVWGKRELNATSTLHQIVQNTVQGISEIRIFDQSEQLMKKFEHIVQEKISMFHNLEMYQQTPRYIIETAFVVMIMVFCGFSFYLSTNLTDLLAQVSVMAAAAFRILPSINRMVGSYSTISFHLSPAITLMNAVSDIKNINRETQTNFNNSVNSRQDNETLDIHSISFKNVSFKYPSHDTAVLQNVNLEISTEKRVGIIGASGSGKSTLIKVLTGLYPLSSGSITYNNIDIHANIKHWHSMLAYVPQDAFLIPGTLRENILFGNPKQHDPARLLDVIEQVGLKNYISSLPHGLDSPTGVQGIELSGGQKQLICLSRALYRQPKLLILDEPTASLDIQSETMVLNVIKKLPKTVTIIMISHKLNNFEDFQDVYVCKHGKIAKVAIDEILWRKNDAAFI